MASFPGVKDPTDYRLTAVTIPEKLVLEDYNSSSLYCLGLQIFEVKESWDIFMQISHWQPS